MQQIYGAGQLDRTVVLTFYTYTTNAAGQQVRSDADTAYTLYAMVDFSSSGEQVDLGQEIGIVDVKFTVRYRAAISKSTKCYITFNGDEYDVLGRQELGRRQFVEYKCRKRL